MDVEPWLETTVGILESTVLDRCAVPSVSLMVAVIEMPAGSDPESVVITVPGAVVLVTAVSTLKWWSAAELTMSGFNASRMVCSVVVGTESANPATVN